GANIPVALAIRLFAWAVLFTALAAAYHRPRFAHAAWFLLFSVILAQPLLDGFDYLAVIAGLVLIVWDPPEEQRLVQVTLPLSLLLAVAFLTRHSMYVMLMMALAAHFVSSYIGDRRRPSRGSWLRFAWLAIAPFVAYLAYNPSLPGFLAYILSI